MKPKPYKISTSIEEETRESKTDTLSLQSEKDGKSI